MTVVELMGWVFAGADGHAREGEGTPMMRHQGVTFLVPAGRRPRADG